MQGSRSRIDAHAGVASGGSAQPSTAEELRELYSRRVALFAEVTLRFLCGFYGLGNALMLATGERTAVGIALATSDQLVFDDRAGTTSRGLK